MPVVSNVKRHTSHACPPFRLMPSSSRSGDACRPVQLGDCRLARSSVHDPWVTRQSRLSETANSNPPNPLPPGHAFPAGPSTFECDGDREQGGVRHAAPPGAGTGTLHPPVHAVERSRDRSKFQCANMRWSWALRCACGLSPGSRRRSCSPLTSAQSSWTRPDPSMTGGDCATERRQHRLCETPVPAAGD